MGLWESLKNKIFKNTKQSKMMNGYMPLFSQFGNDIYTSDVVQQAVNCIVTEIQKCHPKHVLRNNGDLSIPKLNVQNVLDAPNEIMTQSDFLGKIVWNLMSNYNSFVYPVYENNKLAKLYPLNPTTVGFAQSQNGETIIEFTFANGETYAMLYENVIHIRYKYSSNDFMGGNAEGQPDNRALLETLKINHTLLEGVAKDVKNHFAINGVVKYNTLMDDGVLEKNLKTFEAKLKNNESGFLAMDIKNDVTTFNKPDLKIDNSIIAFIDQKILRQFGVSVSILSGDFTTAQYEAFYQKTIEPLIKAIGEALTKGIFSREDFLKNNRIVLFPEELIFLTMDQKIEMARILGDSGSIYENEKRKTFGLFPLPELEGIRMQSLNYINVDLAAKYQINNKGKEEKKSDTINKEK